LCDSWLSNIKREKSPPIPSCLQRLPAPKNRPKPLKRPSDFPPNDRVAQEYVSRSYLAQDVTPGDQQNRRALTIKLASFWAAARRPISPKSLQFEYVNSKPICCIYSGHSLDDTDL